MSMAPMAPMAPIAPRLYPVPGGRNIYSIADDEDIDDEYVPPPPRPRSRVVDDDIDSPAMEEFSAATRQIRKDADSILQRLGSSKKPTKTSSSNFFKNYDYDTRPLTSKYLAPPPDRSHLRGASPSLDEEPDPVLQSLRPGRRYGTSSRPLSSTVGTDRIYTPTSITANRIQSLYKDLDEPLYSPEIKSFDYTECLRRDREEVGAKVRGDVNRRAALMDTPSALLDARERRSSLKRDRLGYDPGSVKSNISIRAQYAAMRAAAGRNIRNPVSGVHSIVNTAPPVSLAPPYSETSAAESP